MGRSKRWRIKRLPEKLLRIRTELGLSQNELIAAFGLKNSLYQSNISSYESGEREPPLAVILSYARLAKISTDELIDDTLELNIWKKVKTDSEYPKGLVGKGRKKSR